MRILITLLLVGAIAFVSVEIERNVFANKELFKSEVSNVKNTISQAEQTIVSAELRLENALEGGNNGIN